MHRILIVDDNLASLRLLAVQLDKAYAVALAKSGEQALQLARRLLPDLVLLDVDMPAEDGFDVLAALRADNALSAIPVIFLTGNNDPRLEILALNSGAADFILKPVEKSILLARLELHLRHAAYQRKLERLVQELDDGLALGIAGLIEYRDAHTGDHVRRTATYVEQLGRAVRERGLFVDQLQERTLDMIVRAAPLHDIGKIGVPDAVLCKPGTLNQTEQAAMRRHTVIGATVLEAMRRRTPIRRYLAYAKQIAESHHEHYDGTGYPHGLAGEAIPFCARLTAVADTYDALTEDRCYRRSLRHEQACAIIREGRGTHFDPHLVDVFVEIADTFRKGGPAAVHDRETPR